MRAWRAISMLLLWGCLPGSVFGQNSFTSPVNPLTPNSSGFGISDLTFSSSFFSESAQTGPITGLPSSMPSGQATMLQAGATLSWAKMRDRSTFSIVYSPSYLREFHVTDYRAFNQSVAAVGTWRLGSKLTFATSFQGMVSDFNQLLFAPTFYGNLASSAATFDQLITGLVTGQSTNPGLAQLLALAPVNGSPQTAFFYGARFLNLSGTASLSYAQSTRSSFHFSAQALRSQYLNAGSSGSTFGPAALIPATNTGSATVGWSYSLTPRTTASIDVSGSRSISRYQDAYTTQFTGSFGHTLNSHWFVQAVLGAGYIMPVHQTFPVSQGAQPQYGGSVAYKFKAQTLLASYTRTVADSYGLGAYATQASTGAWTWNRPGSALSFSAGFGYSRLAGGEFPNTTSWTGHAGLSKRLQRQLFMTAMYSYVQYPEALLLRTPNLQLSGVMVGINWSPSVLRR